MTTSLLMVGAEMLNWSDLRPTDGRPATGGPATAALLDATLRPTDKVLVVGPHSLQLLDRIATKAATVDVLVRSAPDAEQIARVVGRRVYCGALDRFTGTDLYDVVVALDGLPRLVGPDSPAMSWTDALALLKARMAPRGRLLLAAENAFGIERLIQPDVTAGVPRNEDWPSVVDGALQAPVGLAGIRTALGALAANTTVYSVYPDLIAADLALLTPTGPLTAAAIARSVAARHSGQTLMDPYRLVQDAVAAGLGRELAPVWYFVVGDKGPETLPNKVIPTGTGVLLEEQLLAALKIDDQAALRRMVPAYITWLHSLDPESAAIASPDNVIVEGTKYRLFGSGVVVSGGAVEHLARFVRRAQEAGSRQPWAGDTQALTSRLASMVGLTVDGELTVALDNLQPQGQAEQLATIARLSQELADANEQATWFESQLDGIRRSRPYRIGHAVLNPARVIVKRLRRL
ncbi:hypothetical protein AB0P21_29425 [Kribbella sp. NPDC056861]|uniref:hypothetical protein n=1 Tax=Kribbella sp. NPDC056861 TaxID=3154857 RepID=UPI003435D006